MFNGDFVDRGRNSIEVILLLLAALVLYPSSVFLNRGRNRRLTRVDAHPHTRVGNHEDIMVTVRYGFHNEINQKYRVSQDSHGKNEPRTHRS